MRFILRRLGFYLIAAWASLTLNFLLPRMMPGDPASVIFARAQGRMRPEAIEAMKQAYGLSDDPLPVQYWNYVKSTLSGNLGTSFVYFPAPVRMSSIRRSGAPAKPLVSASWLAS